MKHNMRNVYTILNLLLWILLSIIAVLIICNFIELMTLRVILSLFSIIGLAYLEEHIFCRGIQLIVDLFLNNK